MPEWIVKAAAGSFQAKAARIRAYEDTDAESDAMVPMMGLTPERWRQLWSICWRSKVALGLMAAGLVLEILKQTLR